MSKRSSILNSEPLAYISRILNSYPGTVVAKYEHFAAQATKGIETDVAYLKKMGFAVCSQDENAAFCERGDIRIELIKTDVPEHYAWAVQTQEEWNILLDAFKSDPAFDIVHGRVWVDENQSAAMFKFGDYGIIQIIWRKVQIFQGLFD